MPRRVASHGGRPRDVEGRVYITLRLNPDLVERFDVECDVRGVSRTYLVERAMTEWLETHEGTAA